MEDDAIEREYKEMTKLAQQRWLAIERLEHAACDLEGINKKIAKTSHYWAIDEDGIVDVGLGVC